MIASWFNENALSLNGFSRALKFTPLTSNNKEHIAIIALFTLETTLRFGRLRNDVTHKVVNVKAVEDDFKTIKSSKR